MAEIYEPMKPCTYDPSKARFPYLCTPKIDGVRFLVGDNCILSYSMLPIPNIHIQALHKFMYPGMEGELFCSNFQSTMSFVMSYDNPMPKDFQVFVFDYVEPTCPIKGYNKRIQIMRAATNAILNRLPASDHPFNVQSLYPTMIGDQVTLDKYLEDCLAVGWEGVILRVPLGGYKNGRSTISDQYLMRIKPYEDAEGTVVGVNQLFRNDNPVALDGHGKSKRGTSQANQVPVPMMGSLRLRTKFNGNVVEVNCGSGFTDEQRTDIWQDSIHYVGKIVKYKFQMHGSKDVPRTPIFLGFRDKRDM